MVGAPGGACSIPQHTNHVQNPHFAPCFTADLNRQNAKSIDFHCKHFGGSMEECVVSCKHITQDLCAVNKVRKYHSMCKTVESVYIAIETQQRIFCRVSKYSISEPKGRS
jgi:hypothetical protein